jgi:predicted permease
MDPFPVLKRQATIGVGSARFRRGLIAVQVTLSLVLLIAASLFVRSLRNLETLDPGFRTENVITFSVDPALQGYPPETVSDFYRRLPERLRAAPGIGAAALGMYRLLEEDEWNNSITVEGYEPQPNESVAARFNSTSSGYFETIGIPLLAGRDFLESDRVDSQPVAIVNERFARHYFGDRGAVGRRIGLGNAPGTEVNIEIVGVVGDARCKSMREEIPRQVFLPREQLPFSFGMNVYVRSDLPPAQVVAAIRAAVAELGPGLPIFAVRTMEEQRDRSLAKELILAVLAMLFAAVAALLTAIGLYGILSQSVARRTRELGLRMALGEGAGGVMWLVVREVLVLWGIGAAVAVPAALALGRYVESQLYGIRPADPWDIVSATLLLAMVAVLSAAIPVRRATRIAPIEALRYE